MASLRAPEIRMCGHCLPQPGNDPVAVLRIMNGKNGASLLRQVINSAIDTAAACDVQSTLKDFTVLSPQNDPYRLDLPDNHRNGAWFAEVVERLVPNDDSVHLRGLHYRLVAAADVLRPDNGLPYINTNEAWIWLQTKASKAGRWLGYVDFERIIDERNAAPELFPPEEHFGTWRELFRGKVIELPSLESAKPSLHCFGFQARQPYRICLIGEKTSLKEVLLPFAERVSGELCLPTGEMSDSMIHGIAARAAADDRPTVCLYFSDFDPSGWQMPVSVARKLQALRDLKYHNLDIQVIPVALTLEQVETLGLPSTPLKETERRADRWRLVMGHEQTEIDALAALQPDVLRGIVREALQPFFDFSLDRRLHEAGDAWHTEAHEQLIAHPAYQESVAKIARALDAVEEAAAAYDAAQEEALQALGDIDLPRAEIPEPELDGLPPEPLFNSKSDFTTATRRLIAHKRLEEDANG